MKLIYRHENMMILHSIKNILEANDINCYLKNEHGHTMGAEFGLGNTLLELWLHDDEKYDEALTIIEEQKRNLSAEAPPWSCENCGEENAGNFACCWNCQKAQVA